MKKLIKKIRLIIAVVLALIFSGCGFVGSSVEIKNTAVPIQIDEKMCPSISVANIISDLPPEKELGTYHTGCLNIPGNYYVAEALSGFEDRIEKEIETELSEDNYPVIQTKEQLFEDKKNVGEVLVGGVISDCIFDTYDSVCGIYSESTVTVNWKIKSRTTDKIIYEKSTIGIAESPGVSFNAVAYAVRGSFKEVLADPVFVEAMLK
jgi:hypothetical protein